MLGAITGDIVGSRFEFDNYRHKDFDLFGNDNYSFDGCSFTDDTVMTVAVANALLKYDEIKDDEAFRETLIDEMHDFWKEYPDASYGGRFFDWLYYERREPYNSLGNGSAMRVSPAGWYAVSLEEAEHVAKLTAEVTHNHPEGIKGAQATAAAVWMARNGCEMDEIKAYIEEKFYPDGFCRTLDEIRPRYGFDETCQGTVPVALQAFFESKDFEDAIRNAISVGGDSDTIGAITGGVAEAFYGIPDKIVGTAMGFLDGKLKNIVDEFRSKYCGQERKSE